MYDDDAMDRLLRNAMTGDRPALSPDFDSRVMDRVRTPTLTWAGRAIITVYALGASATTAWWLQDLPSTSLLAAVPIAVLAASAASAYARRVTMDGSR